MRPVIRRLPFRGAAQAIDDRLFGGTGHQVCVAKRDRREKAVHVPVCSSDERHRDQGYGGEDTSCFHERSRSIHAEGLFPK